MRFVNWIFNLLLSLIVAGITLVTFDWLFNIRIAGMSGIILGVFMLVPLFIIAFIAKIILSQHGKEQKNESLFK